VVVLKLLARVDPGAESVSWALTIDEVEKRAKDGSLPQPVGPKMLVCCAEHRKKRGGTPLAGNCCIVKFMSPKHGTSRAERSAGAQNCPSVTKMQAPFGKGRDQRQQSRHPPTTPFSIDQSIAENHIPAAFAIDYDSVSRGPAQAGHESLRRCEPIRPKLGVAARQVDGIGMGAGRLVCERREEREFGTLTPPAFEHGVIDEAERLVAGYRNAST
jgi:hypothetical protein